MPERLTPARRLALTVLAHAEATSSTAWYSNHTTPLRDLTGRRRELRVHWSPADWLLAQGYAERPHGGDNLRLTATGRALAQETARAATKENHGHR